jgi:murein DD-endopeptidase MepM/ murein hydrolase activator NlpD
MGAISGACMAFAGACGGGGSHNASDAGGSSLPTPVEATIDPAGGTITLPGVADVTFPPGAFAAPQIVRLEATADPATAAVFTETATIFELAGRSAYDVNIATGTIAPVGDVTIHLTVPGALGSPAQVDAFGDFLTASDIDTFEQFELVDASARDATSLTVVLPGERFVVLRRADGQRSVVVTLGKARDLQAASGDDSGFLQAGATGCPVAMIGPPLASVAVRSPFDLTRSVTVNGQIYIGHFGTDLIAATGTALYAVGNGTVLDSYLSTSFGESIILSIPGSGAVRYAHMQTGSRMVKKGDKVCAGELIGYADNTGLTTGAHLHFEMAPNGMYGSDGAKIDPIRCIDTTRVVPQSCGKWSGSIHYVNSYTEMTLLDDPAETQTVNNMKKDEERWTFGLTNQMGTAAASYDVVDLTWTATYTEMSSTIIAYKPACVQGEQISSVTTADASGSRPSQLAIIGLGGGMFGLTFLPVGNAIDMLTTVTSTDCTLGMTSTPVNVQVVEYILVGNAPNLALLTPASPTDPNTFTGTATLLHTEIPEAGGSIIIDQTVDWNIRRQP